VFICGSNVHLWLKLRFYFEVKTMRNERLGFIGAGQMAEAIARGVLAAEVFPPSGLAASDVAEPRRRLFGELGIRATERNLDIVPECDVLLVAVKPQNLDGLLKEIGPHLRKKHLLITICAGCATGLFEAATDEPVRVVRAMPNLPVKVRLGATALCSGRNATEADLELAHEIFSAVGHVVVIAEKLMDAVTALSGSGPAYFDYLIEAMVEAACREGMPEPVARALAVQTAHGAAEMIIADNLPPGELRRRVTSKAGTTEAAVKKLDELGARNAILEALRAAAERAKELGKR
jgi:pyrroline-5-carboxylate reductase